MTNRRSILATLFAAPMALAAKIGRALPCNEPFCNDQELCAKCLKKLNPRADEVSAREPVLSPATVPAILFQDHIRMFHEGCGGIVIGSLNGAEAGLVCAECGKQMTGFAADDDDVKRYSFVRDARNIAKHASRIERDRAIRLCRLRVHGSRGETLAQLIDNPDIGYGG